MTVRVLSITLHATYI